MRAGRTAVAPLSSPPFRRYLLGQLPSLTGSWAQVVALSWWIESVDPKALGWVVALQFLPSLVLGPWFGVVADRHDRRRLLMLAECGLGLVAAAYALASLTGELTLPVIYVLATASGSPPRAHAVAAPHPLTACQPSPVARPAPPRCVPICMTCSHQPDFPGNGLPGDGRVLRCPLARPAQGGR